MGRRNSKGILKLSDGAEVAIVHGGEPNADCAPVEVLLGCTGRMDALTKARELGIQAPQISLFTEVTAEDVDLASDGQIRWRYWLDGLFVETHE